MSELELINQAIEEYQMMMNYDDPEDLRFIRKEIQYLKEVFKLSEGEAGFLITCNRGEGLLKVGGDSAILAIQPTKKEFEFVETNLSKQAALEKARREAEGNQ